MAKQIAVKITLNNVEREVTFTDTRSEISKWSHFNSEKIFAAKIGRGDKFHATDLGLAAFNSVEEARRAGYREKDFVGTDDFGCILVINWNTSIRNRNAYVVDWADLHADTEQATKQKYYGSIKVGA